MSEKEAVVINQSGAAKLPEGVLDPSRVAAEEFTGCTVYAMYNGPTDMLSAVSTGMAVLAPGGSPHPPHQHPEEEFMIVASGNGEIEVDGKITQVGPGAIMYTAGNTMHGIVNTGAVPMTFYWSKWTGKIS